MNSRIGCHDTGGALEPEIGCLADRDLLAAAEIVEDQDIGLQRPDARQQRAEIGGAEGGSQIGQHLDSHRLADRAEMQAVMAAMLRVYGVRAADDAALSPLPPESGVTQTDAMLAACGILRADNLQLFELGMWQAWSGRG